MRQALTVATMGGRDYMKRCHDKMRSELPKYDGVYSGNLSSTFILLDRSIAAIEMQKNKVVTRTTLLFTTYVCSCHTHIAYQFLMTQVPKMQRMLLY